MVRAFVAIALVILGAPDLWATDVNLFPLAGVEVGVKAADLLVRFPGVKMAYEKKDEKGLLTDGLVLSEVQNGLYWNSALIRIKAGKVQSVAYVRTMEFDRATKNVARIYEGLIRDLGNPRERRIAYHGIKAGKVRSPVFVWKRGDSLVAFSHSPVKVYKTGDLFICQLTIAEDEESLGAVFEFAKDAAKGDEEIFQEAVSE